jgi:DDE superfamily endonuclease
MRSALVAREPLTFDRHMAEMSDRKFQRLYRLSKVDFMNLSLLLRPRLERQLSRPRGCKPALKTTVMLAVTMRILAGASYLDVGWPYGLADATVYVIFDETLAALDEVLDNMSFPKSTEECVRAADNFQRSRQSLLYGIIAALDGLSIAITCPREAEDPRKFLNRKGFYSICVQAAVGADYRIYYVSSLHAGSTHDSTAFRSTQLHHLLLKSASQGGLPDWATVAADDVYGNRGRVLTPYSGRTLTSRQDAYNYFLSSCRIFVEQVFGVIVARFGIF